MATRISFSIHYKYLLAAIVIFCANQSFAQKSADAQLNSDSSGFSPVNTSRNEHLWLIPDYYRLQFAGLTGFLSLGAGYRIGTWYELTFYYGILNRLLGRSKADVHTISLKNSFKIVTLWGCFVTSAGLSINIGFTHNTFCSLPDHYPDEYYFQNKIHAVPFIGGEGQFKIDHKFLNAGGVYLEILTLDAYLLEMIRTRHIKLNDILSVALGFTIYVH